MPPLELVLLGYLAAVKLLGLGMMGFDKSVAVRNGRRAAQGKPSRRRVPERTLFLTAALGGSAGALAGMKRHSLRVRSIGCTVCTPRAGAGRARF